MNQIELVSSILIKFKKIPWVSAIGIMIYKISIYVLERSSILTEFRMIEGHNNVTIFKI